MGALLAGASRSPVTGSEEVGETVRRAHLTLGFLLLGISAVPAYLLFRTNIADVAAHGYFGLFQPDSGTGVGAWKPILAQFLLPSAFILVAG